MTNTICQHPPCDAAPATHEMVRDTLTRWTRWTKRAVSVYRQRRALKRLDSRMLKDIGITRDQAAHEATRPFWDVPKA